MTFTASNDAEEEMYCENKICYTYRIDEDAAMPSHFEEASVSQFIIIIMNFSTDYAKYREKKIGISK